VSARWPGIGIAIAGFVGTSLATLALSSPALGAGGDLRPVGCVEDFGPSYTLDECEIQIGGLRGASGVVVSPDGRSVLVASPAEDAIVGLVRNLYTGKVLPQPCLVDDDPGGEIFCGQSTDGLDGVRALAVSPDDRYLYAASRGDDALVRFEASGLPLGCVDDDDPGQGPDDCAQSTDGMRGASSLAISPDGRSLYVAGAEDDALVAFARDASSGALTPLGCIDDNDAPSGPDDCGSTGASADGLRGVSFVAVSPDGGSVYTASADDAITHFSRDPATGGLTPVGCVDDNDSGDDDCTRSVDGLGGVSSLAISPDGEELFAAASSDDALVRFAISSDGTLRPRGCIGDSATQVDSCVQSADGLDGARSVVVTADGRSVYVGSSNPGAISRFARDTVRPSLTPLGCVSDADAEQPCAATVDGLTGVGSLALAPDSSSLYAAASGDDAIVAIFREAFDTTPPQTKILKGPAQRGSSTRANFKFQASEPASGFECQLDKQDWRSCKSPRRYKRLDPGRHVFRTRATDLSGNIDATPDVRRWRIRRPPPVEEG